MPNGRFKPLSAVAKVCFVLATPSPSRNRAMRFLRVSVTSAFPFRLKTQEVLPNKLASAAKEKRLDLRVRFPPAKQRVGALLERWRDTANGRVPTSGRHPAIPRSDRNSARFRILPFLRCRPLAATSTTGFRIRNALGCGAAKDRSTVANLGREID